MAIEFSTTSLRTSLDMLLDQGLTLRLFQTMGYPLPSNTVEADFVGYAPVPLDQGWNLITDPDVIPDYVLEEYSVAVNFVSTANDQNQEIGGYYITRADGSIFCQERFTDNGGSPIPIQNNADQITITPRIGFAFGA